MSTRIKSKRRVRLGRKGHDNRKLRLESLEQRRLLTVGVPEWNVDALTVVGEPQPIYLYLEGSNSADSYRVQGTNAGDIQFFNDNLNPADIGTFSAGEIASFIGLVNQLEIVNNPGVPNAGNNFMGGIWMEGNGGDDVLNASGLIQYSAKLEGGDGKDVLRGGDRDDILTGGAGDDVIYGGDGNDILTGDAGKDKLYGEGGNDNLSGGADDDSDLFGGDGDDVISGGDGKDKLYGEDGDDTLNGDKGDDLLDGGAGADSLYGGDDNDTLISDGFGVTNKVQYDLALEGNNGKDVLDATGAVAGLVGYVNTTVEIVKGSEFDDQIDSTSQDGPDAAKNISGVVVDGNGGNDKITGTDTEVDDLNGNAGNDYLLGLGGDDDLDGGDGDDRLDGGDGGDKLVGGDGLDVAMYTNSTAVDVNLNTDDGIDSDKSKTADRAFAKGGEAEGDYFPQAATGFPRPAPYSDVEGLIGSGEADKLTGDNGDNYLNGAGGNDKIYGLQGDDDLEGGEGNDLLEGNDGSDFLDGQSGNDELLGGNGVDYLFGGLGDDILKGQSGADYLYGEGGEDDLYVDFETTTPDSPIDGQYVDAALFGGYDDDEFFIDGIVVASRRDTGLNKIDAKSQITALSLGTGNGTPADVVRSDYGFGDSDRVNFI